jgi:hypothetical protein
MEYYSELEFLKGIKVFYDRCASCPLRLHAIKKLKNEINQKSSSSNPNMLFHKVQVFPLLYLFYE